MEAKQAKTRKNAKKLKNAVIINCLHGNMRFACKGIILQQQNTFRQFSFLSIILRRQVVSNVDLLLYPYRENQSYYHLAIQKN